MALNFSPHGRPAVLRSDPASAATLGMMRNATESLQETTRRTQSLIEEGWAVVASANDLLAGRSRPKGSCSSTGTPPIRAGGRGV